MIAFIFPGQGWQDSRYFAAAAQPAAGSLTSIPIAAAKISVIAPAMTCDRNRWRQSR